MYSLLLLTHVEDVYVIYGFFSLTCFLNFYLRFFHFLSVSTELDLQLLLALLGSNSPSPPPQSKGQALGQLPSTRGNEVEVIHSLLLEFVHPFTPRGGGGRGGV